MNAEFDITGVCLETDRLILREFKLSDLDDFYEYAKVEGVGELAGWPHHTSKDISLSVLNNFIKEKKVFAIVYKENNKVIGSLGIELYGYEEEMSEFTNYKGREIGYVLSKDYWGMGLMPEAVKRVIDYLFNDLNYDFIVCGHFLRNKQSERVNEKCGFIPYVKVSYTTIMKTEEECLLRVLLNPNKNLGVKI